MFKEVEKAAGSYGGIDSGILSLTKARDKEHNLFKKYTNWGCDECYKIIRKPDVRYSDKAIEYKESIPEGYELDGYLMIDNL